MGGALSALLASVIAVAEQLKRKSVRALHLEVLYGQRAGDDAVPHPTRAEERGRYRTLGTNAVEHTLAKTIRDTRLTDGVAFEATSVLRF